MNKVAILPGIVLAGFFAVGGSAQAGYVTDGTLVLPYQGSVPSTYSGYTTWRDRVGSDQFEVFGVEVTSSTSAGGTVDLSIYTNYAPTNSGSFGTRTADIAFKLTGQSDFNHGIVLLNHGNSGTYNNGLTAGFYEVSDWKTSQDFFSGTGYIYSGIAAVCVNDSACNALPADQKLVIDTYIEQGTLLGGHNFSVTLSAPGDYSPLADLNVHADYRIDVHLTNVGSLFGPGWEMVFGNATCGNDTIIVTGVGIPQVPEPGTMGVMLLGLLGLGAARRATKST